MKIRMVKVVSYIVTFIVALLLISVIENQGSSDMTAKLREASVPVVHIDMGGVVCNPMWAYHNSMSENTMRDTISPLSKDRSISFAVNTYGNIIESVGFEVRSIDGSRLIEKTDVYNYIERDNEISATIQLKDLLEDDIEYSLIVVLTMAEREVKYYTRIIKGDKIRAIEHLNFVNDFHNSTFDKEVANEIVKYLESSAEGDNTTLANVNIHSSFAQITWGDLSIKDTRYLEVSIREIDNDIATIIVDFELITTNNDKYIVQEVFRTRYSPERMYLLDYDRYMNEELEEKQLGDSAKYIDLGIASSEVNLEESLGGSVLAFTNGGRLYSYNYNTNSLINVFSYYDDENDDIRTKHRASNIKVLNVGETGDISFVIYGYMNRGRHEGRSGLAFYIYNGITNTTEEKIFIESDCNEHILINALDKLIYVNRDNHLFIYINNSILDIDTETYSVKIVADNITQSNIRISNGNNMLMWIEENKSEGGSRIVVYNLEYETLRYIEAGQGKLIKPLGFMKDDIIYGIANEYDIARDIIGNEVFPMYAIVIEDKNGNELKRYGREGEYVEDTSIVGNQLIMKRIIKSELGEYISIADDQITNSITDEIKENNIVKSADTVKQTIMKIALKSEIDKKSIKYLSPSEVLFEGDRSIMIEIDISQDCYYVYCGGSIVSIYSDVAQAVREASACSGVVVDNKGGYIWRRIITDSPFSIKGIEEVGIDEGSNSAQASLNEMVRHAGINSGYIQILGSEVSIEAIMKKTLKDYRIIILDKCEVNDVLYYIRLGSPVLALTKTDEALLIIGYDRLNIIVMNPQEGRIYKIGLNDAKAIFSESGNNYITYVE